MENWIEQRFGEKKTVDFCEGQKASLAGLMSLDSWITFFCCSKYSETGPLLLCFTFQRIYFIVNCVLTGVGAKARSPAKRMSCDRNLCPLRDKNIYTLVLRGTRNSTCAHTCLVLYEPALFTSYFMDSCQFWNEIHSRPPDSQTN